MRSTEAVRLGIVVPCFNEEEVLPETARRLAELLRRLVEKGLISPESRLYFVDDGSRDKTWPLIRALCAANDMYAGIKLSRNRGHQNALLAGLFLAEGDAIVSIDADLQDDVERIEEMVLHYTAGSDVVLGVRSDRRSDSLLKRLSAESYYRLLSAMGVKITFNHADYRLMSRRAIDSLREYKEANLFLRGVIPLIGYKTTTVEYVRSERFAGESKYPLGKMVALAVEGITSFSAAPLRMIMGLGLAVCASSIAFALWAVSVRLFTDAAVPGWASTVVPIYFLGGVQLLCIGVIGEYLAKVYMEVKGRPRFIVDEFIEGGSVREDGSNLMSRSEDLRSRRNS